MTQNLKLPTPAFQTKTINLKDAFAVSLAKYMLVFLLLFVGLSNSLSAQFPLTWTGVVNSDWHNPLNWSPTFAPNAATPIVSIVNTVNDPVISSDATVGVVIVVSGGDLTIDAGVSLNITPSFTGSGQALLLNNGTVTNHGTINLAKGATFTELNAIKNTGSFTSESIYLGNSLSVAAINIQNSKGNGIYNSGTFLNKGADLNIGTTGSIDGIGIQVNDGTFTNQGITIGQANPATIYIDNTTGDGLSVDANGFYSQANSSAKLYFGINDEVALFGIDNNGSVLLRGTVVIGRSGWSGIKNRAGSLMQVVSGTLSIKTLNAGTGYGIRNEGTLKNFSTINIARAADSGLFLSTTADLTNKGTINIGTTANVGQHGVLNEGIIHNDKTINVQRCAYIGLQNYGTFNNNNNGKFTAGSVNQPGSTGISNQGTIVNASGGTITIARANFSGIANYSPGTFTNNAIVKIGTVSAPGWDALYNSGTINNNANIEILQAVQHGFENSTGGQFFNNSNASLTIGTQTAVGLAGINNEGTIQNSGDLEIMQTTTNGFENLIGGVLNNAAGASMGIGVNGSIGGSGIDNDASISSQGYIDLQNTAQNGISNNNGSDFQNSGTLNIDNTSQNGIEVALNASFDNASNGLVNIGIANANSIGNYGILTDGTILNDDANMYVQHTGNSAIKTSDGTSTNSNNGEIHISDCQSRGLNVQTGSVFINTSTVSIENTSDYALAFSSSGSGWTTLNNSSGELIVTGEIASFLHLGGTLSPGKPIGEVFNQSSFGKFYMDDLTLQIEVNGPNPITEHDQVNGSIVELGGPLALDINFTPTGNERIVFLTAATSLSGTFSSVSPALPANWSLDYSVLGEVALVYDSPFPVELLDFTVEKQEDQVLLNWQTASETNNEGFEILHSTDAANWESIHFMPGAGTSQQAQAYEYLHRLPVYGANYYQLKQIDFDGQFSYSDIRLVNLNGALADFEITLYPNPTPANLNITLPFSDTQGKLQVSALDGRVLLQTIVPANQQQMMISTEAWPEGIYLMKIQIGRQTAIRKFQILR